MAVDEALLARARATGEAAFRVYTWLRPTLSLGRHQAARGLYSPERAATLGVDVVRRPTGGRAVLHAREVTYSVAAPAAPGEALGAAYARVNHVLLDGLRRLGVDAHLAEPVCVERRQRRAPPHLCGAGAGDRPRRHQRDQRAGVGPPRLPRHRPGAPA